MTNVDQLTSLPMMRRQHPSREHTSCVGGSIYYNNYNNDNVDIYNNNGGRHITHTSYYMSDTTTQAYYSSSVCAVVGNGALGDRQNIQNNNKQLKRDRSLDGRHSTDSGCNGSRVTQNNRYNFQRASSESRSSSHVTYDTTSQDRRDIRMTSHPRDISQPRDTSHSRNTSQLRNTIHPRNTSHTRNTTRVRDSPRDTRESQQFNGSHGERSRTVTMTTIKQSPSVRRHDIPLPSNDRRCRRTLAFNGIRLNDNASSVDCSQDNNVSCDSSVDATDNKYECNHETDGRRRNNERRANFITGNTSQQSLTGHSDVHGNICVMDGANIHSGSLTNMSGSVARINGVSRRFSNDYEEIPFDPSRNRATNSGNVTNRNGASMSGSVIGGAQPVVVRRQKSSQTVQQQQSNKRYSLADYDNLQSRDHNSTPCDTLNRRRLSCSDYDNVYPSQEPSSQQEKRRTLPDAPHDTTSCSSLRRSRVASSSSPSNIRAPRPTSANVVFRKKESSSAKPRPTSACIPTSSASVVSASTSRSKESPVRDLLRRISLHYKRRKSKSEIKDISPPILISGTTSPITSGISPPVMISATSPSITLSSKCIYKCTSRLHSRQNAYSADELFLEIFQKMSEANALEFLENLGDKYFLYI